MAVVVLAPVAVAFGEREKTASERVVHQLQQGEQIPRPVRQRCAGKHMHHRAPLSAARLVAFHQAPRVAAALRAVVLDVVPFVEHQTREAMRAERVDVAFQQVVVDHHPAGEAGRRRRAWPDHECLHVGLGSVAGQSQADLAHPVVLHRRRADDQVRPYGFGRRHGVDGLARFAQPHVVGEDRAPPSQEKGHALHLVGV